MAHRESKGSSREFLTKRRLAYEVVRLGRNYRKEKNEREKEF